MLAWLGVLVLAFLAGCAPENTPLIEQGTIPASTVEGPAQLFTATVGVYQTPTPTREPDVYDYSVLTSAQKDRLYRASLEYVANTEAEAIRVARSLEYVENEGHPANMCGPLSVSILRDAGLVDRYLELHDFWLLNPRNQYTVEYILEKTFPKESYLWYRTETAINEFDFEEFPLYTGDFIYLYAGPRGTFEHMITVTRVDAEGRAYTITAEVTNGSYLISEQMLYDPHNPGEGYFYDLTDPAYQKTLGNTGFGGFQLWRPTHPISDPTPEEAAFRNRMDKVFADYGGEWHVLVEEIGGEVYYALGINEIIHPASINKVPLALLFFEALNQRDFDDLRLFLVEHGTGGRTYQQLLRAMLVDSEEDATEILLDWTDDYFNTTAKMAEWGAPNTTMNPRRTTVNEISMIFEGLYTKRWVTDEENEIILEFLAEYTSNDETRLGVMRNSLPTGSHFYSKRGSLVKGQVIVAEVAIIETPEKAFLISIFGYPGTGEEAPTYDDLEQAVEDAAWIIWGYLSKQ